VVDAAFPAVGNPMFYPELISQEGLQPHSVDEIWLSATAQPNFYMDVTQQFEAKLAAIHCHKSQINMPLEKFDAMMRQRLIKDDETGMEVYKEQFKRIKFG
jgi:LmbE family N-acetylglucosaminyl deacetylase